MAAGQLQESSAGRGPPFREDLRPDAAIAGAVTMPLLVKPAGWKRLSVYDSDL
jgi:hypothetical protein